MNIKTLKKSINLGAASSVAVELGSLTGFSPKANN